MSDGNVVCILSKLLFYDSAEGRSRRQGKKDIKEFGSYDSLDKMITVKGEKPFVIRAGQVCALRRAACHEWRLKNEQKRIAEEARERAVEQAEKEKKKLQKQLTRMKNMKKLHWRAAGSLLSHWDSTTWVAMVLLMLRFQERENAMETIWTNLADNLKDTAPSYSHF